MRMMFMIVLLFLLAGFVGCLPGGSVCDDKTAGPSLMCQAVEGKDYRLEDVSFGVRIASTLAMAEGVYTPEQLVKVLKDVRALLENPITYATFKFGIQEKSKTVPGLVELTSEFVDMFSSQQTMYARDRELIINYIDKRIAVLEPG